MSQKIIRSRRSHSTAQKFRELPIGGSLTLECTHRTAPHAFARFVGIRIKTEKTKAQPETGMRLKCERIS